jgi:hypothetical protein
MLWRDPLKLLGRRVWPYSVKELSDLPLPAAQVRAQNRLLLVIRNLDSCEVLAATAEQQIPFACDAQVTHPLSVAARRNQVANAVQSQRVDRIASRLAALATLDFEDPRPPHAQAKPSRARDERVHYLAVEPARGAVVRRAIPCHKSIVGKTRIRRRACCESESRPGQCSGMSPDAAVCHLKNVP